MEQARGRARRLVFDCAVAAGAFSQAQSQAQLLEVAIGDPEWRIRVQAAEIVARDACGGRTGGGRGTAPLADGLPAEPIEELLRHAGRFQVRRAAYAVLRERRGWSRLRVALIAAVDSDPKLARQGSVDATWWARRDEIEHVPAMNLRRAELEEPLPALTPDEHRSLADLAMAAAPVMSPYAVGRMTRRLDRHLKTGAR